MCQGKTFRVVASWNSAYEENKTEPRLFRLKKEICIFETIHSIYLMIDSPHRWKIPPQISFRQLSFCRKLFCLIFQIYHHNIFLECILLWFIWNSHSFITLVFLIYFFCLLLFPQSILQEVSWFCWSCKIGNLSFSVFLFYTLLLICFVISLSILYLFSCFCFGLTAKVECSTNFQSSFFLYKHAKAINSLRTTLAIHHKFWNVLLLLSSICKCVLSFTLFFLWFMS
jgi:hypothetical protein